MAGKDMFLYWGSGSAPCWKPMMVLAELDLWESCGNKMIQFSKKEHKSEEVMKLNPRGQAPTFRDGDIVVNESNAICMYLDGKYGNNKLTSGDDVTRALMFQRMFETDNIRSQIIDPILRYKMYTAKESQDENLLKEKIEPAKAELRRWDGFLADQNKKGCGYLAGKDFTMADAWFYPLLATLKRQGVDIASYKALDTYFTLVAKRPSAVATEPPHWKEGPGPLMLKGIL